jgi:hypothetical protein
MTELDTYIDGLVQEWRSQRARIVSIDSAPWIAEIEGRVGFAFPQAFHCLVLRYEFRSLQFQFAELLGNEGDGSRDDLSGRLFLDPHLSPWLIERGLLQFARRYLGDYDPICFDVRAGTSLDAPVVRIDHEDVLCGRDQVRIEAVASGFREFLELLGDFEGDERWSEGS